MGKLTTFTLNENESWTVNSMKVKDYKIDKIADKMGKKEGQTLALFLVLILLGKHCDVLS